MCSGAMHGQGLRNPVQATAGREEAQTRAYRGAVIAMLLVWQVNEAGLAANLGSDVVMR